MSANPTKQQMDALEKYLRGELDAGHPDLPAEETAMAGKLRAAAERIQPDPDFARNLANQMDAAASARPAWNQTLKQWWPSLAGAAGLALLAILVIWVVRSLAPAPVLPAATPESTDHPAGTPEVTENEGAGFYAPLFSETFSLEAGFPASPAEANLYEQVQPEITLEEARLLAQKFGLDGGIYLLPEDWTPGKASYMVTDGKQRLYLYAPTHYDYYPDYVHFSEQVEVEETPRKLQRMAEAYLQEHGLLDFDYRVEVPGNKTGEVRFIPLLDSRPIRYSFSHDYPYLSVYVTLDGDVKSIHTYLVAYQALGAFPLRTAESAWDKMLGTSTDLGMTADFSSVFAPAGGNNWRRDYPTGQPVRMAGRLEKFMPADGGEPIFLLNDYPLTGELAGLELIAPYGTVTVDGQFFLDGEVMKLQVEQWQSSADLVDFMAGSFEDTDGRVYLLTEDNQRLELPDLPPEFVALAEEKGEFYIVGTINGERLEWDNAYAGPMGGGGGGGGGMTSLAKLNLSGVPAPTATPPVIPTPLTAENVAGLPLEGVAGNLYVIYYEAENGQRQMEATLQLDESVNEMAAFSLKDDAGTSGIEDYHLLPVRIWGRIEGLNDYGLPQVSVERYEPVYPGLQNQILVGTEQTATIEGKELRLFTAEDGTAYVLQASLDAAYGSAPDNKIPGGKWVYVHGLVIPDRTFGGYPVLKTISEVPSEEKFDQEQIEAIFQLAPSVIPAEHARGLPTGAAIDSIELVYLTQDLRNAGTSSSGTVYVQPAWCFSGHYADGTAFEIYVQALTDDYLLPEPDIAVE